MTLAESYAYSKKHCWGETVRAIQDSHVAAIISTIDHLPGDNDVKNEIVLAIRNTRNSPPLISGQLIYDKQDGRVGVVKRYHDGDYELWGGGWIIGARAKAAEAEIDLVGRVMVVVENKS